MKLASRLRHRSFALLLGSVTVGGSLLGTAGEAGAATDTYTFRDTLASYEGGAGGNVLQAVANGTTTKEPAFVDVTIDANACANTPKVRAYSFPAFGGLRSSNDKPAIVGESYTVTMIVKFAPLKTGYTRLIDFSNSTLDQGIYILDQSISFYPVGVYAPDTFTDDRFSVLTITRDAASNSVSIFVGLTPAGVYEDVDKRYVLANGVPLHLFMDNTTGSASISESSPGVVSFLRVSDAPITSAQLAATISEACFAVTCGNGKVESGEACDDGNNVDGDGCDATCKVEPASDAGADGGGEAPDASIVPDASTPPEPPPIPANDAGFPTNADGSTSDSCSVGVGPANASLGVMGLFGLGVVVAFGRRVRRRR